MKIKGIANWANIQQPNTKFEPVWSIDLTVDGEVAKALRKAGLKVKEADDGYVFKVKRKVDRRDGTQNQKPDVFTADGDLTNVLVGNGSVVIVTIQPYEWKNTFGQGTSADLKSVQIVDLVPYEPDGAVKSVDDYEDDEVIGSVPSKVKKTGPLDEDLPDVL